MSATTSNPIPERSPILIPAQVLDLLDLTVRHASIGTFEGQISIHKLIPDFGQLETSNKDLRDLITKIVEFRPNRLNPAPLDEISRLGKKILLESGHLEPSPPPIIRPRTPAFLGSRTGEVN